MRFSAALLLLSTLIVGGPAARANTSDAAVHGFDSSRLAASDSGAASGSKDVSHAIDMTHVLLSEGKPIPDTIYMAKDDPDCAHCPDLTLGHAAAHALHAGYPDERDLAGDQKWARGILSDKIQDNPEARPTAEETSLIKRLMGKLYGVAVIKDAYPLLDPNASPPAIK